MPDFPSKETVERVRAEYPPGTLVELIHMEADPYTDLKPGDQGVVEHVDSIGTIFCRWQNGSGLGIVFSVDSVRKILEDDLHE